MGKTHLSGLEIGDPGLDIWASPSLNQKVKVVALNTGAKLHFPEGALITSVRITSGAMALIVGTVSIGTTLHGTEIFTGSTTAGSALVVEKYAPPGFAWVELTAGALPAFVLISYIAALNA